jgi:integrase
MEPCRVSRKRDRFSALGLLPLMEARPWKDGRTVTYRYHPIGSKPVNLGTDKDAAIQKVVAMAKIGAESGTVKALWLAYKGSPDWSALGERTRADYEDYSVPLLAVFGDMLAADITAPMVARYLRIERDGKVRGNREVSLLGNLITLAIERGEAEHNPCRGGQVRRNKERPRTKKPETTDLAALVKFAMTKGGQWPVVVMAAEYCALAGSRKAEFLRACWSQVDEREIRLMRAKQHGGAERVETVAISPALQSLLDRLRPLAKNDKTGYLFPNRFGNAYTDEGFASMWGKLVREALAEKVIPADGRFTFHDLRAYYTTEHKARTGNLPDLHASPTTTAKVYERSRVAKRSAL